MCIRDRYLDYWFWHCDNDKNGLCFWDGADHSGMDNQALRLGLDNVMEYEGVDLNVYLVRELRAMAEIAGELGKPEEAAAFTAHADKLARLIDEVFWDEETGFYYDRSEKTGKLNKVKCISGLLPLWPVSYTHLHWQCHRFCCGVAHHGASVYPHTAQSAAVPHPQSGRLRRVRGDQYYGGLWLDRRPAAPSFGGYQCGFGHL